MLVLSFRDLYSGCRLLYGWFDLLRATRCALSLSPCLSTVTTTGFISVAMHPISDTTRSIE
jgi:hypothetical protein